MHRSTKVKDKGHSVARRGPAGEEHSNGFIMDSDRGIPYQPVWVLDICQLVRSKGGALVWCISSGSSCPRGLNKMDITSVYWVDE